MKPYYYSLNEYIKEHYGSKLYKIALSGGMSCPNRDGRIDTRGCIFCSAGGSGDFTGEAVLRKKTDNLPFSININHQIDAAKHLIADKYQGLRYIAYFQSYTNTYADTAYLRRLFYPVIKRDDIAILSIATRPDCLNDEIIALLDELNAIKPVWIELELQTIHEKSAEYIRRGYSLPVFDAAVSKLNRIGIKPIVHMIIGLPGETPSMILETADYISKCNAGGIKLQLLHVLKNTDLASDYNSNKFETLTLDAYVELLGAILEILPPDMVIHRLTGDGPKNLLIAPLWSYNKKHVLNTVNKYFKEHNIMQGSKYKETDAN